MPCPTSEFGEPAIVGLATDITDRLKTSRELKQLRNYLSNIIDSMPSVLVGVDTDGRVTQWNRQAQTAWRRISKKGSAAQGRPLAKLLPKLQTEMDKIRDAIEQRSVQRDTKRPFTESGHVQYEDVTIYPLITNGVEGAVIRIDDITERVRLEEMIIQSEKMLSIGGLAAGMAHEINNPLAGMIQIASVMSDRLTKDIPANENAADACGTTMTAIHAYMTARGIPRMLTTIMDSGRRAAEIVNNMLSFARKSDAVVSSHNIIDILERTLELAATDYDLRKQYDFRQINIQKEYEEDLPPLPCEKQKIQQVILNILRNSAEAMQSASTRSPRLILRVEAEPEMARIEIEDNGPGMDEATRRRVLEPFFTTKSSGGGTGLGLSVSYFIVTENHGGTMVVDSTPGIGTRFIIRLPWKRGPNA